MGYSTDYCTVSGSGCSSGSSIGRSTAGCIETILPDSRCYGTSGRGHVGRASDYQPVHPHHNAIYCSTTKSFEKDEEFTIFSAIFTIISLISYVIDVGTDISVCYFLFGENDRISFGLTSAITIIPSITVNIFSIKWYANIFSNIASILAAFIHCFLGHFSNIFVKKKFKLKNEAIN